MTQLQTRQPTNTWVTATWDDYIQIIESLTCETAKCYYYNGQLRIEMSPVGPNHAYDNWTLPFLVNLFGIDRGIPMRFSVNCSYQKRGIRECQPDVSCYIGKRVSFAPKGSSVVDLDNNQPPDLAIEVADTTIVDDLGPKRMLYEEVGVAEYWVVDVNKAEIIAFEIIAKGGSQRITESRVLPGLEIGLLAAGLQRDRTSENTEVGSWFLEQIRGN